ncbi:MAG: flagellar protein export ATPase FliI [Colwellia sp.]
MVDSIKLSERLKQKKSYIYPFKKTIAGRLVRVVGLTLEAVGVKAHVGSQCLVETMQGNLLAEIVGFSNEITYLMPEESLKGVLPGASVVPVTNQHHLPLSNALLGRIINGIGKPIDDKGPIKTPETEYVIDNRPINPLSRRAITEPLDVGIRSINSFLTVGKGQRMGLFAGSGVGKSVLMGMMTHGTTADVIVVGLVGERGREVKEFIEEILGEEGLKRSVIVASPADNSPLMRLKGCETAVQISEYFRDKGQNVLLLLDSLTRYAQAQREIALAVGEPPATKGYPPSVFSKLPQLVERAGNGGDEQGSITAFYTVLTEGDDLLDPIADAARAILDGHVVLSRELAESGHYPAIDIEASISRVMPMVTSVEHQQLARQLKQIYSLYQKNKDLISIGAYTQGNDPMLDHAISVVPVIDFFLQQQTDEVITFEQSIEQLGEIIAASQARQAQGSGTPTNDSGAS